MLIYLALVAGTAYAFVNLPEGFLPVEDQGFFTVDIQTPPGASYNRTQEANRKVEEHLLAQAGVATVTMLNGFSFSGQAPSTSQAFVTLKPWSERDAKNSAAALVAGTNAALASYRDATVDAQEPPPVDNLGNAAGFSFRLQDRANRGYAALLSAQDQLLKLAQGSPILQKVKIEGLPPTPQAELIVDREKAAALGVKFEDINATIQLNLGSVYTNDFPNRGKMQRVYVQAEQLQRMNASDILNYAVKNASGTMVPMSSFAELKWGMGPSQIVGFNGYQSVRITGEPNPGYTSGDAIAEMERLMLQLPKGFGYAWTGQSFQEKQAGSQASLLLALSVLIVFLCLAALYESWAIPVSVLLVIPLGVIGAVGAVYLRGMPNDVYFKIGLITIIGLSAKNAILIVEFAKDLWRPGNLGDPGRGRGLDAPVPADRDDLARLHLRRGAAGHRHRRRLEEPAGDRHRRDGRHDHRDRAGSVLRPGLLRGGDAPVPAQSRGGRRAGGGRGRGARPPAASRGGRVGAAGFGFVPGLRGRIPSPRL